MWEPRCAAISREANALSHIAAAAEITTPFRLFVFETIRRACAGSPRLQEFFRAMVEAARSFRTRCFSPAPALRRRRVSVLLANQKA